jgi:hypothetical protein
MRAPRPSARCNRLLDGDELTLVEAAMEALGNLGAVTSGPRISNVAESDSARRTIPYALKALLRLIPAENVGDFVHLRFGDFNKVFSKLYDSGPNSSLAQLELDRISSLSQLKTVLPELRGRGRRTNYLSDHAYLGQ